MAKKDFSQLVAHVEQKQEVKEEATNLDEQLKLLKDAVTHIINNTLTLEHEGKNIEKLVEALNAAKGSIDNAITGICNAITHAHQTPVKVDFTDKSKAYLEDAHKQLIENEDKLIKEHEKKVDNSLKTLGNRVEKAMNGYRGIFVDKKTFNIYYWLFIVIMEIALCSSILLICYMVKFGKL